MCLPDTNLASCVLGQDKLRTLMGGPRGRQSPQMDAMQINRPMLGGQLCIWRAPMLGLAKFPKVEVLLMVTTTGDRDTQG